VAETFRQLGLDWRKHVVSDPKLFRPPDIERSCGNLETGLLGAVPFAMYAFSLFLLL
jgi:hypothetical protein